MKHFPSEKYNVAWFKLSECVARGEKERALGVYKLLAHSINDSAFASQLKGDLLLSFDDKEEAIKKYIEAVRLYKKQQRFLEAAAVCEHLIVLQPNIEDYFVTIIVLYDALSFKDKMRRYLIEAIEHFSISSDKGKFNAFLKKLQEEAPTAYLVAYQYFSEK